jgi:hypothetical protein
MPKNIRPVGNTGRQFSRNGQTVFSSSDYSDDNHHYPVAAFFHPMPDAVKP